MKKNKLLISVTTTTVYEHLTDQDDADLAWDEWYNNSATIKIRKLQVWSTEKEIFDFIINKPKGKKK